MKLNRFFRRLAGLFRPRYSLAVTHDNKDKNRPTVVLLHGIAATSKTWRPLLKQLDGKRYRIIALDLLGFGKSPKPNNCRYDVDEHVASLRKTLRGLKIQGPYILVGHSMGAIIAAHYARVYQSEVKGLFLLGLPVYLKSQQLKSLIPRTQTDLYLNIYKFLTDNKKFTIANSQILRQLLKLEDGLEVTEKTWYSFRQSLINTIINQDVFDDLRKLKMPVKVIYGLFDAFLVPTCMKYLRQYKNVSVIKLIANDHLVNQRFSAFVAKEIDKLFEVN
jgi:pimeloyl-ACP methyl ester carboxylesterase